MFSKDVTADFVKWPLNGSGYHHTGEGGLAVFLIVPDDGDGVECGVTMPSFGRYLAGTVIVRGQEEAERRLWGLSQYDHEARKTEEFEYDRDLLAVVCIGSSAAAWLHEDEGYFKPTFDDLTPQGQRLFELLFLLHGSEPEIITLLDT